MTDTIKSPNAMASPLLKAKERYIETFVLALVVAAALFIPYIIRDNGYFLFYGDFNVQQVPFYKLAHRAVKSGDIFWSFRTDLGANFIGSYSFYLLGSPFFWLTIPFSNDFVPALMGPLLILKFACAAIAAYAFITRFVKNKGLATLGGLLYAFSGFSVYNVFFNHFHEPLIFFPLLLLSIELLMKDGKRGWFAVMVALCLICNYYFAFGMAVFGIIYVILRMMSGKWNLNMSAMFRKRSIMKIVSLVFEALLGLLISFVIFLPAILAVADNSRVGSYLTNWSGLVYKDSQRYLYILQCFFFPPDLPARPIFFPDANAKWSSVAGWLPLFSMTGVIVFLRQKRGSWQKRLINICMIMAFIPFLNSSFSAFNYSYYARWFFMPVLIMALMTVMALEDKTANWFAAWGWSFGITVAFMLLIGFYPQGQYADGTFSGFGLHSQDHDYPTRFWITCAIAVASSLILLALLFIKKTSFKLFLRVSIALVCVISLIYSTYFVGTGKKSSYDSKNYIVPTLIQNDDSIYLENASGEMLVNEEIDDLRIDVYEGMDNTTMFFGMSGIQAFHSIVPGSVMDFYKYVGVERTVGSRPSVDYYGVRGLTSVKYVFDYAGDGKNFAEIESDGFEEHKLEGYSPYTPKGDVNGDGEVNYKDSKQNDYFIFQNDYYIPYGFTYEYYMTKKECDQLGEQDRSAMMVKALLLDEEQANKYSTMLSHIRMSDPAALVSGTGYVPSITIDEYLVECKKRAKTACTSFTTDSKGFTATTTPMSKDNLVFFSIPYEDGWSATVDGVEVDVEKVNVGFMAVAVPGDGKAHTVRFNYKTPGLGVGLIVSGFAIVLTVGYFVLFAYIKKKEESEIDTMMTAPITCEDRGELLKKFALKFVKKDEDIEAAEIAETPVETVTEQVEMKPVGEKTFKSKFVVNNPQKADSDSDK